MKEFFMTKIKFGHKRVHFADFGEFSDVEKVPGSVMKMEKLNKYFLLIIS